MVCNPLASFHSSLEEWRVARPNRLKAAAALKDALALLADAPSPLLALFPLIKTMDAEVLYRLVSDTLRFLRSAFVPAARKFVENRLVSRLGSTVFICSPLAGGIPSSHLDVLASSDQCNQRLSFSQLRFGVLNPGRNGFSAPHSGNTLWWRLWDVGLSCFDLGLHAVVVPGPRLLPGTMLPAGFPYIFIGPRTSSWASVSLLISAELAGSLHFLDDVGNDRVLWFSLPLAGLQRPILVAAVYAPSNDSQFWTSLLQERSLLLRRENALATLILGDLNVHLADLVCHADSCSCLHCRPTSEDKLVRTLLSVHGLVCLNPPEHPTHVSSTIMT